MTLWCTPFISVAADTTIVFSQVPYTQIFQQAAQENKMVFLYFHFDGCGACVKMEKTAFRDTAVADYFNDHFVSLDINTRKGEGIETNKIYNVSMHPTFLFLDDKGQIVHQIVGLFSPEDFLAQAQNGVKGESTYTHAVKKYNKGNRDPDFLFDYCYILRDAFVLNTIVVDDYIQTQSVADFDTERNIKFIYEFALVNHDVAIPLNSPAYNFMLEHQDKFTPYFDEEQIIVRLVWIANKAAYKAIEDQNEQAFNQAIEVIEKFPTGQMLMYKEMDGRTTAVITETNLPLKLRMEYEREKGNTYQYRALSKQYVEGVWDDADALNTMAWNCYLFGDDPKELKEALKWSKRSIQLDDNYANNDTYAALLYKSGKYDQAYEQAQKALAIARNENLEYQETMDLIKLIKEHQE